MKNEKDKHENIHDTDEANKPEKPYEGGPVTTADETDPTGGIPQGSGGGPTEGEGGGQGGN